MIMRDEVKKVEWVLTVKELFSMLRNMDFSLLKTPHFLHVRDMIRLLFKRQKKSNLMVGWNG